MKKIIAATRNKHKIVEIEAITKDFGMEIISRDEAGIPKVEIPEDGDSFNVIVVYEAVPARYHEDGTAYADWTQQIETFTENA